MKKFNENELEKMSNNEIIAEINKYADKCEVLKNEILKIMDNLIPKQQNLEEYEQEYVKLIFYYKDKRIKNDN